MFDVALTKNLHNRIKIHQKSTRNLQQAIKSVVGSFFLVCKHVHSILVTNFLFTCSEVFRLCCIICLHSEALWESWRGVCESWSEQPAGFVMAIWWSARRWIAGLVLCASCSSTRGIARLKALISGTFCNLLYINVKKSGDLNLRRFVSHCRLSVFDLCCNTCAACIWR